MPWRYCIGILFVLSTATPLVASPVHRIIGSPDEDAECLFFPRQAEIGPDSNIYALDSGDAFIKVFSPSGEFLHKFGGEGEGPGEFQRIDGATIGFTWEGSLFFTEFIGGHRWITIMDLHGQLDRVVSLEVDQLFGVQKAFSLPDGRFLVQLAFSSVPRPVKNYYLYDSPVALTLVDSQGRLQEEILRLEHTSGVSYSPDGGDSSLPFAPGLSWTVVGKSGLVWTEGLDPNLNRMDLLTHQSGSIPTPLPEPRKVKDDDIREWVQHRREFMRERNPVWWDRFGRVVEELGHSVNKVIPNIGRIERTPAGHFLIHGSQSDGAPEYGYWLLDENGARLAFQDPEAWNVHFSGSCLMAVSRSSDGEDLLHVISDFGSEAEALIYLSEVLNSEE